MRTANVLGLLFRPRTKVVVVSGDGKGRIPPPATSVYVEQVHLAMSDEDQARSLRVQWMRQMDLDESEIAESLQSDPPLYVEEELKQLQALRKLKQITPSRDVLRQVAIKY